MGVYDASKCLYAPLREKTDLFKFNIIVTLRSFGDPVCVCVPLMKPAGQVTLKLCPWQITGQHQLRRLHTWLDAGGNTIDSTENNTSLLLYLILAAQPQQRALP